MTPWTAAADGRPDIADELVMDGLAERWDGHYRLEAGGGEFRAYRLTPLTADTPAGLDSAIRADYARHTS